jgi:mevalonate kinase
VILLGEQFVVHGEPAIVLAIDKRATVEADTQKDKKIRIRSKNMKTSGYFLSNRFYTEEGGGDASKRLEPVYAVAKNLLGVSKKDIGVNIEIDSSIPVAAGLGSSADVAVASAAALSNLLEAGLTKDEIFQVAFEAEKIVHGTPLGVDSIISTYGGVIRYCKGEKIEKLDIDVDLPLVIGDTKVERSTGEMVAHVNDLRRRYPFIVDKIIRSGGEAFITRKTLDGVRIGE